MSISFSALYSKLRTGRRLIDLGTEGFEFQDAIVLSALKAWCKLNGAQVYVISRDERYRAACDPSDGLHPIDDLGKFLALINSERRASSDAMEVFSARRTEIVEMLSKEFNRLGFYLSSEADGDVVETSVDNMDPGEPNIIAVDDDQATLEVECEVEFTAEISFKDPNTGAWDGEDKTYVMMDTVSASVTRTAYVIAEVLFEYGELSDLGNPTAVEISISFPRRHESIPVKFDPWSYRG